MYTDSEGGVAGSTDQFGFVSFPSGTRGDASLGFIANNQPAPSSSPFGGWGGLSPLAGNVAMDASDDDFSSEPPLLHELGFDFVKIGAKVLGVLHPFKHLDDTIMVDTDMAGPIAFALILGVCMLFTGKVHFGYIYGFGAIGTLGIYAVTNLMAPRHPLDVARTFSILGYCLLPMVALAAVAVIINLRGAVGTALGLTAVLWCATSAARFFEAAMHMAHQRWLVAYPCFLFYACFALMAIF